MTGSHTAVRQSSHCATDAGILRHPFRQTSPRRQRHFGTISATLRHAAYKCALLARAIHIFLKDNWDNEGQLFSRRARRGAELYNPIQIMCYAETHTTVRERREVLCDLAQEKKLSFFRRASHTLKPLVLKVVPSCLGCLS